MWKVKSNINMWQKAPSGKVMLWSYLPLPGEPASGMAVCPWIIFFSKLFQREEDPLFFDWRPRVKYSFIFRLETQSEVFVFIMLSRPHCFGKTQRSNMVKSFILLELLMTIFFLITKLTSAALIEIMLVFHKQI